MNEAMELDEGLAGEIACLAIRNDIDNMRKHFKECELFEYQRA